jgi:hypothetical protein
MSTGDPIDVLEEVALDLLGAVVKLLGPDWIAQQVAKLFAGNRDHLNEVLELEYRAAEMAAQVAEQKAFPK